MLIERPVGHGERPVVEVAGPAAQQAVELVADLGSRPRVGRVEQVAHFVLDPLQARLRGAGAQIAVAVPRLMMQAEAVSEELEPLPGGILQRGLGLVDAQSQSGHGRAHPAHRLVRLAAAEDDQIVSVSHDMCL
jgi:hypothetical protein